MSASHNHADEKGRLIVLGAGNWGTTLAILYAPVVATSLWTRTREQAELLQKEGENSQYLPKFRFPDSLRIEAADDAELNASDSLLIAVPSHKVRNAAESLSEVVDDHLVISAAKGFEHRTMKTMSEVLREIFPLADIVTLSGPNIAREIAEGKPTRAVLASKKLKALSRAAKILKNEQLIFETSLDQRGTELCASLKGIMAITVGLASGFELGDNFTGLLMTYGMREFATLAHFMGIEERTVYGIAGLGDMITSSLSPSGRNHRFGRLLAQGLGSDEALKAVGMVVEGVEMLKTINELEELNIAVPLFSTVKRIVDQPVAEARELLVGTVQNYPCSLIPGRG